MPGTRGRRLALRGALVAMLFVTGTAVTRAQQSHWPIFTSIPATPEVQAVRALLRQEQYEEAKGRAESLLDEATAAHGPDSPEAADALELLFDARFGAGGVPPMELEPLARRSLEIRERVYGPDDLRIVPSLLRVAGAAFYAGEGIRLLEPLTKRALGITEKTLGPDHPDLVDPLRNEGVALHFLHDDSGALKMLRRCQKLGEKTRGPMDPGVITCIATAASVLEDQGDLERSLADHTLIVDRIARGGDLRAFWVPGQIVGVPAQLAVLGRVDEARRFLEEWAGRFEAALGPDHPNLARYLVHASDVLSGMGRYEEARRYLEKAIRIFEHHPGTDPGAFPMALMSYAELLIRMGDCASALPVARRSLQLSERMLAPASYPVARALNLLGYIEARTGDDAAALVHVDRAILTFETTLGDDWIEILPLFSLRAILERRKGDGRAAQDDIDRAIAILRHDMDSSLPLGADYLGSFLSQEGLKEAPASVRPILDRAASYLESAVGKDSLALGRTLALRADVDLSMGDRATALADASRAEAIGRSHLRRMSGILEERLALSYAAVRPTGLSVLLSLAAQSADPVTVRVAWDDLIASRALVLDEMAARHRVSSSAVAPEIVALRSELARARSRHAALAARSLSSAPTATETKEFERARREMERLETDLAARSAEFRRQHAPDPRLADIAATLPPHGAIVAFVRYDRLAASLGTNPREPRSRTMQSGPVPEDVAEYLAFVQREGDAPPAAIALGPAAAIDPAVDAWRREVSVAPTGSARVRAEAEARYRAAAGRLADLVWAPVARHLAGSAMVFIVPDGLLNTVAFATLPAPDGSYLLESGPTLHELTAERDLLRRTDAGTATPSLLAIGGPDFDASGTEGAGAIASGGGGMGAGGTAGGTPGAPAFFRGARSACGEFRTLSFDPLPAARREAQEIARLWRQDEGRATVLTGAQASEAAFKVDAPGHRVLHIATHGFFVGDRCPTATGSQRQGGAGGDAIAPEPALLPASEGLPPIEGENPLVLSGLALAGANLRATADPAGEDGILTAEEIASVDLSGVEWAVLSACDSGVGPIVDGEGVLGLRRAFAVAGVGTTIMSLWPVQDGDARRWMLDLYRRRLQGDSTAAAVRAAALEMLRDRRARGLDTHPAHWGAFVAAGDWR
jgi:CHAT domain-containing protein/tetratricopeptide (TPR) repeat protein